MADLVTLIRLHKHELDEKRQKLAALNEELARLEQQHRTLEREFEREKESARASAEAGVTFSGYAAQVKRRRAELDAAQAALEGKISAAKDSMMETFGELKKYEKAQEERDRAEAQSRALKESKELDEIGLEGFRRKGEE
jgi:flagellar FliJ protein